MRDIHSVTYVLNKLKGLSDEPILEHFKESFLSKIELLVLGNYEIDTTKVKARVLVLLFKAEIPHTTSIYILADMNCFVCSISQDCT